MSDQTQYFIIYCTAHKQLRKISEHVHYSPEYWGANSHCAILINTNRLEIMEKQCLWRFSNTVDANFGILRPTTVCNRKYNITGNYLQRNPQMTQSAIVSTVTET